MSKRFAYSWGYVALPCDHQNKYSRRGHLRTLLINAKANENYCEEGQFLGSSEDPKAVPTVSHTLPTPHTRGRPCTHLSGAPPPYTEPAHWRLWRLETFSQMRSSVMRSSYSVPPLYF